jgi:hypothetical protein
MHRGSGELRSLKSDRAGRASASCCQVWRFFSGFYLNELLNRLLPRDEAFKRRYLSAYAQVLGELAEGRSG